MTFSIPHRFQRSFPAPSLTVFVTLQVLDILTTLLGLQMGAREASFLSTVSCIWVRSRPF